MAKTESTKSAMKPQIAVRIVVTNPVPGVTYAVQRGRAELLQPVRATKATLVFEFALTVADIKAEPPRFTGPFAQGPAFARFVYVNSGTMAGQDGAHWTRRAKVPLHAITSSLLTKSMDRSGVFLEASIRGEAKDGGPACGSVPLLSGWTIAKKS